MMHYLCGRFNLTILVYSIFFNRVMVVDEEHKEIRGILGRENNKLIQPNHLCKLLNEDKVGSKLVNSSEYDGALGKLQKKAADLFFKPEWPFIDPEVFGFTPVVAVEDFSIMHSIVEKIYSFENDKRLFLTSLDWPFLFLIFITKAVFVLMVTLIIVRFKDSRLLRWPNNVFKTARFVFVLAYESGRTLRRPSLVAVVFFGIVLFNFLAQEIICINFNTNKVVVDTDSLITDRRSLFKSQKKLAWLASERDMFIARNSPPNTFLHNLHLKNEQPMRIVQNRFDANLIEAMESNLFFLGDLPCTVALNYFAPLSPRKFYFSQVPLFSAYNMFYRKKERSLKMDYIDAYATKLLEGGLPLGLRRRLKETKFSVDKNFVLENRVYRSRESYVSQNTFYDPINVYSFYYIIVAFLAMCFSIVLLLVTVRLSGRFKIWFSVILDAIRTIFHRLLRLVKMIIRKVKSLIGRLIRINF